MVWTGGAVVLPTPPPSVPQPFQPSVSQEAPAAQADGTPTTPSTPDAERRQLTVLFCDLVDSTRLARDWRCYARIRRTRKRRVQAVRGTDPHTIAHFFKAGFGCKKRGLLVAKIRTDIHIGIGQREHTDGNGRDQQQGKDRDKKRKPTLRAPNVVIVELHHSCFVQTSLTADSNETGNCH